MLFRPHLTYWPLALLSLIFLFSLLVFANILGDPLRVLQEDIAFEWHGMHAAANEQLRSGQLPHWSPYALGGQRLLAKPQLALFYPGTLLFRVLSFSYACLLTWILHFTATALTTYIFSRLTLGTSRPAALVGGIVFAYSGFSLGHCNHLNFVCALPWLPLMLLAVHQFHQTLNRFGSKWWLIGTLCLVCQLLAGGIPVLVLTLVATAWLIAVLSLQAVLRREYHRVLHLFVGVVGMALFAAGLAAIQILPTIDLYANSNRSEWTLDSLVAGGTPWPALLGQLLAPGVLGDQQTGAWAQIGHENFLFIGGAALSLAIVGTLSIRIHKWVVPLLLLLIVSLVLALGDTPILRALMTFLPGNIRQPSRFLGLAHLSLAMLAAIGLDRWLARNGPRPELRIELVGVGVSVVMASSTIILMFFIMSIPSHPEAFAEWHAAQFGTIRSWLHDAHPMEIAAVQAPRTSLILAFMVWCSGGLIVWGTSWLKLYRPRASLAVVGGWITLELFLFSTCTWAWQNRLPGVAEKPTPIIEFLQRNLGDERYFNAAVYLPLWEDRGAVFGLANLDSMLHVSKAHHRLMQRMHGSQKELDLFSTKYVLLREGRSVGDLKRVFSDNEVVVYENPHRLGMVRFIPHVRGVATAEQATDEMAKPDFKPTEMLLITDLAADLSSPSPPLKSSESCRLIKQEGGQIEIETTSEVSRWLFISVSYDKGWQTTLDGNPIPLYRADACFMAVHVPAGQHTLKLNYHTPRLVPGLALTVFTIAILLVVWWLYSRSWIANTPIKAFGPIPMKANFDAPGPK